jgi:hypothetical protein
LKKVSKVVILLSALFLFSILSLSNSVKGATEVTLSTTAQTETTVTLSWSKSGDLFFSNYKVKIASSVNGPYSTIVTISNKDTTAYGVTGLSPNTDYYFEIQDTDSFGDATSNQLQVKTKPNPKIIITSRTQTTISLKWSDYNTYSSQVPFESYVIQMSTNGAQYSTLTTITDVTQNTYTVTGLSPATYNFRIYDKVGAFGQHVSYSDVANVKINPDISVQVSSQSTTVEIGQQVQLAVTASGGTNSYRYQWYANGNPISGATSASYSYAPSAIGTISIYATAQDTQDSYLDIATSNSISLTVTAQPTPSPTSQPNQQDSNGNTDANSNQQSTSNNQGMPTDLIVVIIVVIIAIVSVIVGFAIKQKQGKSKPPT